MVSSTSKIEVSAIRLLQGERRFGEMIMLAILSFAGGYVVTPLVKHFFSDRPC
jgi:hypothetical protein